MVRKHVMKHKCTRALIVAILTCSFSLGSVPASVGAWQLSRAIERAQMGYSGNSVSYASGSEDKGERKSDDYAVTAADKEAVADATVAHEEVSCGNDEGLQSDLRAGGVFQ